MVILIIIASVLLLPFLIYLILLIVAKIVDIKLNRTINRFNKTIKEYAIFKDKEKKEIRKKKLEKLNEIRSNLQ